MSVLPIHIVPGSTSVSVWVHISKQSDGGSNTDQRDATGLVTTDLTAKYCRTGGTEQTITLSALGSLNAAYSSGGFFEAAEGWYRLDLPDAAVAAGARQCFVRLSGNPSSQHVSGHLHINLDDGVNVTAINSGRTDGNNATLKLKQLHVRPGAGGGHGFDLAGGDANGATPAGDGLHTTGGTASTTGGGTSGQGINAVGGSGAASTNGAGDAVRLTAGSVTTVAGGYGMNVTGTGVYGIVIFNGSNEVGICGLNAGIDILGAYKGVRMILSGSGNSAFDLTPGSNGHGFKFTVSGSGHPFGPDTIDAQAVASATITSAKFAAGAIDATVVADGTIDRATFAADTGMRTVRSNTLPSQAGLTAVQIKLDAGASAQANFYIGDAYYATSGSGDGQILPIVGYDATNKIITVAQAPLIAVVAGDTFAICKAVYGSNTIILVGP